jgi:hypothetical protein
MTPMSSQNNRTNMHTENASARKLRNVNFSEKNTIEVSPFAGRVYCVHRASLAGSGPADRLLTRS